MSLSNHKGNIVVQTLATCWAQQCCVLLANNVASVCTGLNYSVSSSQHQVMWSFWSRNKCMRYLHTILGFVDSRTSWTDNVFWKVFSLYTQIVPYHV